MGQSRVYDVTNRRYVSLACFGMGLPSIAFVIIDAASGADVMRLLRVRRRAGANSDDLIHNYRYYHAPVRFYHCLWQVRDTRQRF